MNTINKQKIDWSFARYLSICGVAAASLAPVLQPAYHANNEAMAALVTIFTVMAGFMMTVIAIAADGRNLRRRDWRQDTFYLSQIRNQLTRYRIMFHLYLVVPALAIVAHIQPAWSIRTQSFVEGVVLFLSIFALLWSFRIPGELTQAHVRQLKQAIKDQQEEENRKLLD